MIAVIRISGLVKIPGVVQETLFRMRLRRKYSLIFLHPTPVNMKLLNKVRNYVAYGDINEKTLLELIEKRAESVDKKKVDAKMIVSHLEKKSLSSLGLKPFIRLHPPRGGIDAKKHFGVSKKAVLGDNKEKINDLIRRML